MIGDIFSFGLDYLCVLGKYLDNDFPQSLLLGVEKSVRDPFIGSCTPQLYSSVSQAKLDSCSDPIYDET